MYSYSVWWTLIKFEYLRLQKILVSSRTNLEHSINGQFLKRTLLLGISTHHRQKISTCSSCYKNSAGYQIKKNPPWNILFFGSDEFSLETLKKLKENMESSGNRCVKSIEVACKASPCKVRSFAKEQRLAIHTWPIPTMKDKYDVGVIVSFGRLIPERVINMFPHGILNVHASLLPRWRGAAPLIHSILNGDETTGISIMEIRPKRFDIGPLLLQKAYAMPPKCTMMELRSFLAKEGATLLLETLCQLNCLESLENEQGHHGITYAHKVKPYMAYINWADQTAVQIERQYRAIHEMMPLKTKWKGEDLKLLDMILNDITKEYNIDDLIRLKTTFNSSSSVVPGTVLHYKADNSLVVKCLNGWVAFRNVVLKKPMSSQDFYNGYLSKVKPKTLNIFESRENFLYADIYNEKATVRKNS